MHVDKTSFLLALGTLAAGGAGGYIARDRNVAVPRLSTPPPSPPVSASAATLPSSDPVPSTQPPAACDDMAGHPAECPPAPYPADEGVCAPIATKRCEDFKSSMKPRVAERAVSCILALNPAQRCDRARVNLCGHAALMSACEPTKSADTGAEDLGNLCRSIVGSCSSATFRDCEATLAGMTAAGRDRMLRCMGAHCSDKGLLGCEAAEAPGYGHPVD
jgi:hypothetical protein